MTWQPDPAEGAGPEPAGPNPEGYSARGRHGWRWAAMVTLLAVGLTGLAAAAVGVAHEVLPRQFTIAQQRQIMAWEMTRRWRALPAGKLFPATVTYQVSEENSDADQSLNLQAQRLGIGSQASCGAEVSSAAARVLSAHHCSAMLRATYLDSSGSMVVTLGIAVLPNSSAAQAAASGLTTAANGTTFAVRALAIAGSPASGFRDRQRQLAVAMAAGPYVIMSTAGFTDGRRHLSIASDQYYDQEMTSLASGLAEAASKLLGAEPLMPTCPGAPGC